MRVGELERGCRRACTGGCAARTLAGRRTSERARARAAPPRARVVFVCRGRGARRALSAGRSSSPTTSPGTRERPSTSARSTTGPGAPGASPPSSESRGPGSGRRGSAVESQGRFARAGGGRPSAPAAGCPDLGDEPAERRLRADLAGDGRLALHLASVRRCRLGADRRRGYSDARCSRRLDRGQRAEHGRTGSWSSTASNQLRVRVIPSMAEPRRCARAAPPGERDSGYEEDDMVACMLGASPLGKGPRDAPARMADRGRRARTPRTPPACSSSPAGMPGQVTRPRRSRSISIFASTSASSARSRT